MNITREVITDLLPVYLSKEASNDTRALVEEFFKQDPEFAAMVNDRKGDELLQRAPVAPLTQDHERETLQRTKSALKWRTHWLALAILFTLMPLSCVFSSKGLEWIMIRDASYAANTYFILAAASWIQYFRTRRKVRLSGM
jgi:hypothetical protein